MDELDKRYPQDCAFCRISQAYPPASTSPIPTAPNPDAVSPQCHLILSTPYVLAFLDIMPMAPGHILVTTRDHFTKINDIHAASSTNPRSNALETARALGEWLPRVSAALCQVTGIEDWNIVQNNGARAAQVVPHVHFHLIPRYGETRIAPEKQTLQAPMGLARSWKMFGRGTREDLDEEEGKRMAARLRDALRGRVVAVDEITSKL